MGTFTIRNCKFSGSLSGATTYTGVFMGWCGQAATHVNCLAAGTYSYSGTLEISRGTSNTYENCYKTQNVGSYCTYTTATGESLRALLGDGWEVSSGNVVPKMVPDIVNPVFTDVTISNTTADVSTDYVDFIGTYSPITYASAHKDVLFLGGKSKLYYPDGTKPTTINACRAYFTLKGITAGDPANGGNVKGFVLNFGDDDDPDGIRTIDRPTPDPSLYGGEIYNLAGQRVTPHRGGDGRGLQRGIYIHNGKKEVVK